MTHTCPRCRAVYAAEVPLCARDGELFGAPVLDGRYRLLAKIGEGGMGLVYRAEHLVLGKKVAVKVLRGEIAHDAQLSARFQQEAVAASQIGHPAIVDVTDFGRMADGALYYVMEFLEGVTLAALMEAERVPLRRALELLAQIAGAVEAANARGIVHRDLKPQNVMVLSGESGDRVKVLDFGISKVQHGASETPLTNRGAVLGTAEYMSPEQAAGETVDARTDVYALGVIAYELVTGTLPHHGEHTVATILKHLSSPTEPPRVRAPDAQLPAALDALIVRCLEKSPAARPASMADVRRGLLAIAAALDGHAVTPIPLVTVTRRTGERAAFAPTVHSGAVAVRRRRRGVVIATAVVALAASGVVLTLTRGEEVAVAAGPADGTGVKDVPEVQAVTTAQTPPSAAPAARRTLTLRSSPPGAEVRLGDARLGRTPLTVEVAAEATGPVRFSRDGYRSREVDALPADGRLDVTLEKAPRRRASSEARPESYQRVDDLKSPF